MDVLHDEMKGLEWLLGGWLTETATTFYPTMAQTVTYRSDLTIAHFGQPVFNYSLTTQSVASGKILHCESGFIRRDPENKRKIFLVVAHKNGVTEISEGVLDEDAKTIAFSSKNIAYPSAIRLPEKKVTKLEKKFALNSQGQLEEMSSLGTEKVLLCPHTRATYDKINT